MLMISKLNAFCQGPFLIDMEAIDLLEKRIAALELQVLPSDANFPKNNQKITDLLLQTQTMITSALSCRDIIVSILQHMVSINTYLDPAAGDNMLEVEAKRLYLLELYPELKDTIIMISTLQESIKFIDSPNIMRVTELCGQLEQLAVKNLGTYEKSRDVTHKVLQAIQQYNDISHTIKLLFMKMDNIISELETALQPKLSHEE